MKLAYQLWGQDESKSRIVFLHGMGGTGALWRPLSAVLEEKMQVLALDQRGHGRSQIPHIPGGRDEPRYTPLDYGKDITETLEDLRFHPTWMVGHSMGVRSAVAAAHLKPKWIQGLILVDLGLSGFAGGGLGEGLAKFIQILPSEFESRDKARTFMTENCPDPSIAQYLMAVSVRESSGRITFPFDHSALIQTIYAARDSSVRQWVEALGEMKIPIIILRGEKSLVWSHEDFEKERSFFSRLPSIQFLEFANAGHGLPFEQRAAFLELIERAVANENQRQSKK